MPANTRPKQFVARGDFYHGTHFFKSGDPVSGASLQALLAFGDKFVTEDVPARKGDTPTKSDDVGETKEN